MNKLKEIIKSTPYLNNFARWVYNILKINDTTQRLKTLEKRFDAQEEAAYDLVRKHLSSQLIYLHEKIDTFLETANKEQVKNLKETLTKEFFDEYYLNFENTFRGSRTSILKRYEKYLDFVPFLNSNTSFENLKTLDIGCGRGEWVELLQKRGVDAHGIDMNPKMLKLAHENNLKNIQSKDAFDYLKECKENSFDLITAFHVIEHIPFENLVYLLQQIKRVAKPNATILLETPNPQNLEVASCNFYTDPTHLTPLPANMIKFLVQYLGFENVQINYLNPKNSLPNSPTTAQDYLIVAKNTPEVFDEVKKKLLFDISLFHKTNLKTGIHRVVSKQLEALQMLPQNEYTIIPVYLQAKKSSSNQKELFEYKIVNNENKILHINKGDILFTSDLSYNDIQNASQSGLYTSYKNVGVKMVFLVHDILPLQYEDYFVKGTKEKHQTYINNITKIAHLLITTTQVGKNDLKNYCKEHNLNLPKIEVLPLGSDISSSCLSTNNKTTPQGIQPSFLMVGTIEPRKAHAQVIKAFDILWQNYMPNEKLPTLTIVGKQGWLVEDTINMIKKHTLLNKALFYIEKPNDNELLELYEKSSALIMASHAEGYGLPLVEAMHYQKPIIARNIPVFKEIAGDYPIYFDNTNNPQDITKAIKEFLSFNNPNANLSQTIKTIPLSWENHTKKLITILNQQITPNLYKK